MAYTWSGVWTAATAYPVNSLVSLQGAYYVALTGTSAGQSPPAAPWSVVPDPFGSVPSPVYPAHTVTEFRAQAAPWFIAHRGSGAEFPEHTLLAYDASAQLLRINGYIPAIEVSVVAGADKTLFCMHDPSFDKSTNSTGLASAKVWAETVALVRTEESDYLGPGWPGQQLVTLREVFDRFIPNTIIFVEAKTNEAIQGLQRLLISDYPEARNNVVIKMSYDNPLLTWAKANGFTTWGYLSSDGTTTDGQMDTYDSVIDMWGVPHATTDARVSEIVARGKDCIVWEVHRRWSADHWVSLGVKGLMCSRIAYVTRTTNTQYTMRTLPQDNFASKTMMPGMLETDPTIPTTEAARAARLKFDPSDGSVYFPNITANRACVVGALNDVPAPASYNVLWSMMWPVIPPVSTQVSGVVICKPDDQAYTFTSATNPTGGYHIFIRANGEMLINRHDPGTATTTSVANGTPPTEAGKQPPVAGTYMTFRIEVRAGSLTFVRTDVTPEYSITSSAGAATTYRGPYMQIASGNITQTSSTPHFRAISMPTV